MKRNNSEPKNWKISTKSTYFYSRLLEALEEVPREGYQWRGQSTRSPNQELHVL